MLESREALILETLREMPKGVVLIGGYAVNAYVPPRFSIDCDVVVLGGIAEIRRILAKHGFEETERGEVPHGEYIRSMRKVEKVSFDLLVGSVLDRESGVAFEGGLFKKYSRERVIVGRANPVRIEMRIADPELLFAMKFVSARRQDVRDVFMLSGTDLNWALVKQIIEERCGDELIKERIELIKAKVTSKNYRDSLQGAYGRMPNNTFDSCISNLVEFLGGLT